jgi:hypothetical protein
MLRKPGCDELTMLSLLGRSLVPATSLNRVLPPFSCHVAPMRISSGWCDQSTSVLSETSRLMFCLARVLINQPFSSTMQKGPTCVVVPKRSRGAIRIAIEGKVPASKVWSVAKLGVRNKLPIHCADRGRRWS